VGGDYNTRFNMNPSSTTTNPTTTTITNKRYDVNTLFNTSSPVRTYDNRNRTNQLDNNVGSPKWNK